MNHLVHIEPLERSLANWIEQLTVDEGHQEQLWFEKRDDGGLVVRCIPFFVYGLSLHDVVEIDPSTSDFTILQDGGNATFRIWLAGVDVAERESLWAELVAANCRLEVSSQSLWAVSVPLTDAAFAAWVLNRRRLNWETGKR